MSFVHPTQIVFSQVDAAGILYFSRAFEIAHEAWEAFRSARGWPLGVPRTMSRDWMLPIVHAEVDFRSPLRLGDHVQVEVGIERLGDRSLTAGFRLRGPDDRVAAEVRHVHTAVDPTTFASRPLPSEVRAWADVGSVLHARGESS